MTLLRRLSMYAAWACLVLGIRLADWARDGVGDADES